MGPTGLTAPLRNHLVPGGHTMVTEVTSEVASKTISFLSFHFYLAP
jgi:hypothetical protein